MNLSPLWPSLVLAGVLACRPASVAQDVHEESDRAGPHASASAEEADEDFARLLHATRFTDGAIYAGGVTPNEVIALRRLARREDAAELFARLEREATLPGRLYALCGLYRADPEAFRARVDSYRGHEGTVTYQTGCLTIPDQPIAELVEREKGVRLSGAQSVKDWLAASSNPNGTRGGYRLDLAGGGIPDDLLAGGGFFEPRDEPYSPDQD